MADFDSMNPAWDVRNSGFSDRQDVFWDHGGRLSGFRGGEFAVVSGSADYEICSTATGYRTSLDLREAQPGMNLCVRTSENRYALVTIKKIVGGEDLRRQVQLGVVVWDPPAE
jgi:hypothetical protein